MTKINLKHNACSKLVPLSENQVVLISYDRELFLYDLIDGNWSLHRTLSNSLDYGSKSMTNLNSSTLNTSSSSIEISQKANSILDRMKMFDVSHQIKKNSLIRTTEINPLSKTKDVHSSNICGFALNNKDNSLITTELAGFIKTYSI